MQSIHECHSQASDGKVQQGVHSQVMPRPKDHVCTIPSKAEAGPMDSRCSLQCAKSSRTYRRQPCDTGGTGKPTHEVSPTSYHRQDSSLSPGDQLKSQPYHDAKKTSKYLIEGSLEVKLPTIWRDEKQSREEAERRERLEERRSEEKESEERRCRCAKRKESRETLCFSNDLWLRRAEK